MTTEPLPTPTSVEQGLAPELVTVLTKVGQALAADIPVIMVTGVAEKTGIKFDGKSMGEFLGKEPEAYLEKPIDPESLKSTVASVCP